MREEDIRKKDTLNRYLKLVEQDVLEMFNDKQRFLMVDCPACGSKDYEFQFEKIGFTYVLCDSCRTLYVNPRPSFKDLMRFYTQSKSAIFWVEEFFKPVADIRREKIFRPRAEYVKSIISGVPAGAFGDIGAGFGIFLEELAKLMPDVKMVAIEPSLEMAEICRRKKIEVIASGIEDVSGWEGKFSFLSAFELLEHVCEPKMILQKAKELLNPDGLLLLTTLNGEGFDIQILWEKSKSLMPPHHLNFFNPDSISLLLKAQGFRVIEVTTPGQLDWDIVEGAIKNEKAETGRFWKIFSRKGTEKAKNELQDWITCNKLSSHMSVLACRKD